MIPRIAIRKATFFLPIFLISVCSFSFVSCALLGPVAKLGLIKVQFGCLPEGTLIDTVEGAIAVEQLKAGDQVIGYRGDPVTIQQVHQYQEDVTQVRHLRVEFEGGGEVQLSPRHRIGGIPARDLKVGDEVEGHLVVRVDRLGGVSRSFDLLTDDEGYRIQGVPVNSMIREMAESSRSR